MSTNVETMLPVSGMSGASCVAKIEKVLRNTAGVTAASVNLVSGRATVEYDRGRVGLIALASAIEGLGYEVPWDRLELLVLHRARHHERRERQPMMRDSAPNAEHGALAFAETGGAPA